MDMLYALSATCLCETYKFTAQPRTGLHVRIRPNTHRTVSHKGAYDSRTILQRTKLTQCQNIITYLGKSSKLLCCQDSKYLKYNMTLNESVTGNRSPIRSTQKCPLDPDPALGHTRNVLEHFQRRASFSDDKLRCVYD